MSIHSTWIGGITMFVKVNAIASKAGPKASEKAAVNLIRDGSRESTYHLYKRSTWGMTLVLMYDETLSNAGTKTLLYKSDSFWPATGRFSPSHFPAPMKIGSSTAHTEAVFSCIPPQSLLHARVKMPTAAVTMPNGVKSAISVV